MKLFSVSSKLLFVAISGTGLLFGQAASTKSVVITRETKNASACNICLAGSEMARQGSLAIAETKIAGFVPDIGRPPGSRRFTVLRETTTHGLAAGIVAVQGQQQSG